MIKTIYGISIRFFKVNKFITLSSILSVMLAVFLIITMANITVNAKQSFMNEIKKLYGDMDLSVGYNLDQKEVITKALSNRLSNIDGISQTSKVLISSLRINEQYMSTSAIGVENDALVKSRYHFTKNLSSNEVVLNENFASVMKVNVGDYVTIQNQSFKVKEIIDDVHAIGAIPNLILLHRETLQNLIVEKSNKNIEATYLLIKVDKGVDILELATKMKEIDQDLRTDIKENDPYIVKNLQNLSVYILILSALVLFITALLVISNMGIFLYKYQNQNAILRGLGATTKQMFFIVFFQCSIINVVGTLLGVIIAIGNNTLLKNWVELLLNVSGTSSSVDFTTVLFVAIGASFIIQLFMLIPAYKNAKTLPLNIIQQNENEQLLNMSTKKTIGKIGLLSSIFLFLIGKFLIVPNANVITMVLSTFLFIASFLILFSIYLSIILEKSLPIINKVAGTVSFVAIKNVIPQFRKNVLVTLTISTVMMITVFGSSLFMTIKENEQKYLKDTFLTNIIVKSGLSTPSQINSVELQREIEKLDGVKVASPISTTGLLELNINGKNITTDYSFVDFNSMKQLDLLPRLPKNNSDSMIISEKLANQYNIHIGDTIPVGIFSDETQRVEPVGTVIVTDIIKDIPSLTNIAFLDWTNSIATISNNGCYFYQMLVMCERQVLCYIFAK